MMLTLGENEIAGNLAVDQAVIFSVSTDVYFHHTLQVDTHCQMYPGELTIVLSKRKL